MFLKPDVSAMFTHWTGIDDPQPWSSNSESLATASQFAAALAQGYYVNQTVLLTTYWFGAGRRTTVYHFMLMKPDTRFVMNVQTSPSLERMLRDNRFKIHQSDSRTVEMDWAKQTNLLQWVG